MRGALLLPILCVLFAGGCGSNYKLVPVSGKITLNGEPLVGATILTQPRGTDDIEDNAPGPGSYGHTDEQGRFALELQNEPRPGAVPGKCVIMITEKGHSENAASDELTREDYRTRIPDKYRNGTETYVIPEEGTDAMNIEISTGG